MATESIIQYFNEIFTRRRYCKTCESMTQSLAEDQMEYTLSGTMQYKADVCNICNVSYGLNLMKMNIKESYGVAIINPAGLFKLTRG